MTTDCMEQVKVAGKQFCQHGTVWFSNPCLVYFLW